MNEAQTARLILICLLVMSLTYPVGCASKGSLSRHLDIEEQRLKEQAQKEQEVKAKPSREVISAILEKERASQQQAQKEQAARDKALAEELELAKEREIRKQARQEKELGEKLFNEQIQRLEAEQEQARREQLERENALKSLIERERLFTEQVVRDLKEREEIHRERIEKEKERLEQALSAQKEKEKALTARMEQDRINWEQALSAQKEEQKALTARMEQDRINWEQALLKQAEKEKASRDQEIKHLKEKIKPARDAAEFASILFDYDKASIRADARDILKRHAERLQKQKNYRLTIEGHCDDRGTNEYNLALGERRAREVQRYLVSLGLDQSRITTISYGEEMPVDPRSNEEAWARNRRVSFVVSLE